MENKKEFFPIPLLLFLIVGAFIRFYNIEHIIFYWDEPIHSVRVDYQPLSFVVAHNNFSAFFSLLVHFLLYLGKIELMSRLASAICGTLSILVVYLVGKMFFTKKEGLLAAAFVAFSPFLIRYSQYARAYSTLTFFTLLSLYFFLKAVTEEKNRFWVFYSLFTSLSVYTHLVALLILPAYALYFGFIWVKEWIKSKKSRLGKKEIKKLRNFILWTLFVIILVVLLYLPDKTVGSFFSVSLDRAASQPSDSSASFSLIKTIFITQMEAKSFFLPFFLFFFFLGFLASIKKYPTETLFLVLYLFIPFLIFLLINPRTLHVRSADRYFIFSLPLVFLLFAKGMTSLSSFFVSLIARIKRITLKREALQDFALIVLVLVLIGGGFDLRQYYLKFWRSGSFRLDRDIKHFLQSKVKEDSLIVFDGFPTSNLIMVANPLTKNLRLDQYNVFIRDDFNVDREKSRLLIYRVSQSGLDLFLEKDVGLWVIFTPSAESQKHILSQGNLSPYIEATQLKGKTILHFKRNHKPLADKMIRMTDILLSLEPEKPKEKELRSWAARIHLLRGQVEEASEQLKEAREISLTPSEARIEDSPVIFKVVDKIFGLNDLELRQFSEKEFFFQEMARTFFSLGNRFFAQKEYTPAYKAYRECSTLDADFDSRISNRLSQMGTRAFLDGNTSQAILFFTESLRLDPGRSFIHFLLAEAYKKEGCYQEAQAEYEKVFGQDVRSPQNLERVMCDNPVVLVWHDKFDWHIFFRSKEKAHFSGTILANRRFKDLRRHWFASKDRLKFSDEKIEFSLELDRRKIKAIEFAVQKKLRLRFDIRVDGHRSREKILLLNRGGSPEGVPFDLK